MLKRLRAPAGVSAARTDTNLCLGNEHAAVPFQPHIEHCTHSHRAARRWRRTRVRITNGCLETRSVGCVIVALRTRGAVLPVAVVHAETRVLQVDCAADAARAQAVVTCTVLLQALHPYALNAMLLRVCYRRGHELLALGACHTRQSEPHTSPARSWTQLPDAHVSTVAHFALDFVAQSCIQKSQQRPTKQSQTAASR